MLFVNLKDSINNQTYTLMKNISTSKFIQSVLMMVVSACAAVIVILTIDNLDYFCEMTDSYFIPFIIIIGFSAICGISFYVFYKLWYSMFIK